MYSWKSASNICQCLELAIGMGPAAVVVWKTSSHAFSRFSQSSCGRAAAGNWIFSSLDHRSQGQLCCLSLRFFEHPLCVPICQWTEYEAKSRFLPDLRKQARESFSVRELCSVTRPHGYCSTYTTVAPTSHGWYRIALKASRRCCTQLTQSKDMIHGQVKRPDPWSPANGRIPHPGHNEVVKSPGVSGGGGGGGGVPWGMQLIGA